MKYFKGVVQMNEIGAFCEVYGNTIRNRILEYLLENQDLDFAVGDMAKELGISKPKAYDIIKEFVRIGYVKKSRIIGKTQLIMLNREDKRVKLFLKDFRECLRLVAEESGNKGKNSSTDKEEYIFFNTRGKHQFERATIEQK